MDLFVVFEKCNFNCFSNKISYKNYTKINTQTNIFWYIKYFNFVNKTFVLDLVCYENNSYKNTQVISYEIYLYGSDQFISVKSDNRESLVYYKNSVWLEREVTESFGYYFKNSSDNRNLLMEYSNNQYPLKVCNPLESFIDLKSKSLNFINSIKSQSVEL